MPVLVVPDQTSRFGWNFTDCSAPTSAIDHTRLIGAPDRQGTFSAPPPLYEQNSAALFFLSPCRATALSRVRRLGSGEAAVQRFRPESHSAGSRRFAGTAHAPLRQKNGLRSFSVRETFMALASGLVTAVDDQEQAAASLSNATPALLPPTIDCHRKQPDGRLHHRNRPFVLVGATGWVCP
jgi:hypothetical protein